jgi:uncharacterized Zn finger protein
VSRTWWGRAWLSALESAVDPGRLQRGNDYARRGRVMGLDIAPGRAAAWVRGSRVTPYAVAVSLRAYTDAEWDRVLDVVSSRVAHTAALLDGELPAALVDDVGAVGLSLLPAPGELSYDCSCPDEVTPCKHAAAVCLLVANLLDQDPFELLLLRGRSRDEVLEALRARRSGVSAVSAEAGPETDVDASVAFVYEPAPLPDLPLPPARPGRVVPLPGGSGSLPADLASLAADAAQRAWELLNGTGTGGLDLTPEEDLARRAVALLGTPRLDALAKRSGLPPRQLARRAAAWARGGREALALLDDEWTPEAGDVAEGAAALGAGAHVYRNRVSDASDARQLRLGRDGRWYPFRRVGSVWELSGAPAADPAEALRV